MADALIAFACPRCDYRVDSATAVHDPTATPTPGDLTICLMCAAPLEFGDDMLPRWLTYEEVMAMPREARSTILFAQLHIATMRPATVMVRPRAARAWGAPPSP